eukprot:1933950-Pleurochrysis_carterae.AAC.1
MACWGCAEKCGACCYLKPAERELLDEWLPDAADRALYESMVGDDGWCVHYDKVERLCTVYDDRPQFCRVDADKWQETLGLHEAELARTAREACKDWIGSVYGAKSDEMLRYQQKMALLVRSERERRRSAARLKGTAFWPDHISVFTGCENVPPFNGLHGKKATCYFAGPAQHLAKTARACRDATVTTLRPRLEPAAIQKSLFSSLADVGVCVGYSAKAQLNLDSTIVELAVRHGSCRDAADPAPPRFDLGSFATTTGVV